MDKYKHRGVHKKNFMGEEVNFIEANERVVERVENLSHERYLIQEILSVSKPDDIFWDVGACLGIHSFITALHIPYGKVYSFEPMPVNRAVLVDNMSINRMNNINISKFAMSDSKGETEFSIRQSMEAGFGRHGISKSGYEDVHKIQVEKTSGDWFANQNEIPNIVKIDVEGASPLVLKGMEETLKNEECREVFIETHEPNPVQPSHEDFGFTREDIINFIKNCGFKVQTMKEEFHIHATKDEFNNSESLRKQYNKEDYKIRLEQDDISNRSEDIIINSAGTSLRMGSGCAGSLRREAGEKINTEAIKKGPAKLGEAIVTDSYKLNCEKVIHAVSMPHYGDGKSTPQSIRKSVRNALKKADDMEYNSVAIPAVGCGIAGIPITQGAPIILNTIDNTSLKSIEEIVIVTYSDEEYDTIIREANRNL
jgi:FkbM family methyltransferase